MFEGFKDAHPNISLGGSSTITSKGALELTNSSKYLIGHAFYSSPVHLFLNRSSSVNASSTTVSSFSTTFVFTIVPKDPETGGGHGIAFILAPSKQLRGSRFGQYLGIFGRENNGNSSNHILAVEFDTVQGFGVFNDINSNHVGIDINGLKSIASQPASYDVGNTHHRDTVKLESGKPIQAWIQYDGATKLINVTISPLFVPKPTKPLLSIHLGNLSHVLRDPMYVGFSSATGKLSSAHYILGWSFRVNEIAQSLNPARLPSPPTEIDSSKAKTAHFIGIGVASSAATIVLLVLLVFAYLCHLRSAKYKDNLEDWEQEFSHRFPYKDLFTATKGFKDSEILGSGGFGVVYKGVLPATKEDVAIKRISHNSKQGIREFAAEIESLGRMRHRHLIRLHGWCRRKDELLLVYDFMSNGSLDGVLFNDERCRVLDWKQRLMILRGIASSLLYLHEEWEQVVVHRDVKANNVLLDDSMEGRLGDFGLARLYEHGKNPGTTNVVGTLGYIAPELARTGKATTSCDVFSYGALLLEVACGRRSIEPSALLERVLLAEWVRRCWEEGEILAAADTRLGNMYVVEEMEMVLKLGLVCSQKAPEKRPSVRQVMRYLDHSDVLPGDVLPGILDVGGSRVLEGSSTSSVGFSGVNLDSLGSGRS
ncbi:L-type lectin-domain containing receptor kinase S.4-like [Malania oleifera]|uniref:L-type lectin-domain containing receptor kinase S.4-like n=1 Tax=Malania oleifera TaxID=397392 RepID=UPI0025AE6F5C|nr:L-type lectin-domain containing receptor kinase S.4-like [Malania oleifera]